MTTKEKDIADLFKEPPQQHINSMLKDVDFFKDYYSVMTSDRVPAGIRNLETAIKLSRKVHAGKMKLETAEKKLKELQADAKFQWRVFSKVQLKYMDGVLNGEYWINLAEGAVRSGKTICASAAWLLFLKKSKFPRHMITGKTKDTLFRNVLSDIFDILGEGNYHYNKAEGILSFMDKTIWALGANDERSESRFRGTTVGSWYGDEVTTYPESVMKMAISRPSVEGAVVLWTTNPDTPYHPIYKEYVTNQKLHDEKTIVVTKFLLADNLTLPKAYVQNLKNTYTGVWYDRFINGLWTVAEGAIFDMFIESEHTFHKEDIDLDKYVAFFVGVDYGTATVTSYVLAGIYYDEKGKPYYDFLDEYYYDATASKALRSDSQHVAALKQFIEPYNVSRVFTPHDATSFMVEALQQGIPASMVAPDVIQSIRRIQSMLTENRLRMCTEKCDNLIKQFQACVWDSKAQSMGVDKPLKPQEDHAMDASRYLTAGHHIAGACPDPTLVIAGAPML